MLSQMRRPTYRRLFEERLLRALRVVAEANELANAVGVVAWFEVREEAKSGRHRASADRARCARGGRRGALGENGREKAGA